MEVGKSVCRVDAFDKATGRAKYCDDLCDRSALVARVLHSTIANGGRYPAHRQGCFAGL